MISIRPGTRRALQVRGYACPRRAGRAQGDTNADVVVVKDANVRVVNRGA